MAVLLHPRKDAPERYRVWDRETRTQKYFPLSKQGKRQAEEFDEKISKIKYVRSLNRNLAINILFTPNGQIKGMRRKLIERQGRAPYEYFALYANRRQKEIAVGRRGFDEAYSLATQWLLEQHQIDETRETRLLFKKARRHYWCSLVADKL